MSLKFSRWVRWSGSLSKDTVSLEYFDFQTSEHVPCFLCATLFSSQVAFSGVSERGSVEIEHLMQIQKRFEASYCVFVVCVPLLGHTCFFYQIHEGDRANPLMDIARGSPCVVPSWNKMVLPFTYKFHAPYELRSAVIIAEQILSTFRKSRSQFRLLKGFFASISRIASFTVTSKFSRSFCKTCSMLHFWPGPMCLL